MPSPWSKNGGRGFKPVPHRRRTVGGGAAAQRWFGLWWSSFLNKKMKIVGGCGPVVTGERLADLVGPGECCCPAGSDTWHMARVLTIHILTSV